MFLVKDNRSPFYKLVYFDKAGNRRKISTKETHKRKAEVFMHNFNPSDLCIEGVGQNSASEAKKEENQGVKLQAFYDEYLSYTEQIKSKNYLRSIKFAFNNLIKELGNIGLLKIDKRLVETFINKTYKRSERSAALFYRTLKAAFAKAEDWEYVKENPFKKVKLPKLTQPIPCFVNFDDLKAILDHEANSDYRDIYLFAFFTGMRRGEILSLAWKNIDLEKNIIVVKNGDGFTTKNKKDRIVPICNTLKILIDKRAALRKNELLFTTSNGVKYYEPMITRRFKTAVKRAGLDERIHFHTLRHSFASALVQNGVSLYVIKELLGHQDIKTTMVYSHLRKDDLIEAVSKLNVA